ncbi:hypothetical protein ACNKHU_25565 [Shigella flexneri]
MNNILTLTRTWGFTIWVTPCFLAKENNPGARSNEAYSGLPVAELTRVKRTTRLSTTMSNWYPLKISRTHRGKLSYPVSARNPDAAVW